MSRFDIYCVTPTKSDFMFSPGKLEFISTKVNTDTFAELSYKSSLISFLTTLSFQTALNVSVGSMAFVYYRASCLDLKYLVDGLRYVEINKFKPF